MFSNTIKTIAGIIVFATLATTTISCGKKKGGGGGSTATAPDCTTTACTVGQGYASGVFFRSVVGQGSMYNKSVVAKMAFFGQNAAGLNMNTNPVTYNGAFVATGTMRFADGAYYGVSSTSTRSVAGFGFGIEFGISIPGFNTGYNYGYGNNYQTGQGYYYPCGYNDPYCNGGGTTQPCYNQYGCNGGGGTSQCTIPAGDYSVTTIAAGNYSSGNGYYSQESFSGLKLRFTYGSTIVDATINQGQLQGLSNGTTSSHTLRGQMVINTVNNVACNQSVQF